MSDHRYVDQYNNYVGAGSKLKLSSFLEEGLVPFFNECSDA